MAMGQWIGVNGVARQITNCYTGQGGIAANNQWLYWR